MEFLKSVVKKYTETSLIIRIVIGLVAGAILGRTMTGWTWIGILGSMFVGALRAVAPVLVFVLIISALSNGQSKLDSKFGLVLFFYMFSTFLAAAAAVVASFVFPVTMRLGEAAQSDSVPQNVGEVLRNLLLKMVENPVSALVNGNYIGILFWAAVLGLAFKKIAAPETRRMLGDAAEAVSAAVRGIINLAPFGICGLVYQGIRIPFQEQESDKRIDHQRDEHHAADKYDQKAPVILIPWYSDAFGRAESRLSSQEAARPIFPSIWNCARSSALIRICILYRSLSARPSIWTVRRSRSQL